MMVNDNENTETQQGYGAGRVEERSKKKERMELNDDFGEPDRGTRPPEPMTSNASNATVGQESWRALLVQSNVLSDEDRRRIEMFFTTQTNPTPEKKTFRIKLHQEKRPDDSGTGGVVRETLYLELDYETFGYKKLRSTKKK
uniref:Uncharacterized protein n=1 Tax=Corethron hystrix TaxID=216773 RepID=A0A7S1BIZ4_9STRA|mmetsp:Transcript_27354/g.62800  ORF Transcript_27354/g.62800 Transcript_27354/m.62800 type:complete len:142 (+) Transcript_27354:1-426(+)